MFADMDFTLLKYDQLCKVIVESGYSTATLEDYFSGNCSGKFIILRHDIDRMSPKALEVAEIERKYDIRSTYYFRSNNSVFQPEIIGRIRSMGHEIGYHYEILSTARGNLENAIRLFEIELDRFRQTGEVTTISMHGSPLSPYDNRDLWKTYDFRQYGIIGEAYLSIEEGIVYYSDTGRCWSWKNKMRDIIGPNKIFQSIDTTDDLIELIREEVPERLYISTHPERWAKNLPEWTAGYARDLAANLGKKTLTLARSLGKDHKSVNI